MNPWTVRTITASAYVLAAIFLIGAVGIDLSWDGKYGTLDGRTAGFHGGKSGAQGSPDPACQSKGCHDPFPHRKNRTESAFRNMHQEFSDCLSCHGTDPEKHWVGDPPGRGRRIRYEHEPTKGSGPHAPLGQAIGCRKCHSETGLARLREKGMTRLSADRVDPVAIRMLEGGPMRWAPPDLR